jgi:hypothetical protein
MKDKMSGAMFGMVREAPMGVKKKQLAEGRGAGSLADYPDTAEKITSVQDRESAKIKGHPLKPGQRQ